MSLQKKLAKKYNLDKNQSRELMGMLKEAKREGVQIGTGLFDKALSLATKTANVVQEARSKSGVEGIGPRNPDWDYKVKPGEKHAVVKKNGQFYRTKFAGPGTHLIDDIKEGIAKHGSIDEMIKPENFVTKMDLEGLIHDIRYGLAPLFPDPAKAVLAADAKFIEVGQRLLKDPEEAKEPLNIQGSLVPIAAKHAKDLLKPDGVLNFLDKNPDGTLQKPKEEDRLLMEQVLNKLAQKGYGIYKPPNILRPERMIGSNDRTPCNICGTNLLSRNMRNHQLTAKKCLNYKLLNPQ